MWLRYNGSEEDHEKVEFLSERGSGCDVFEVQFLLENVAPLFFASQSIIFQLSLNIVFWLRKYSWFDWTNFIITI